MNIFSQNKHWEDLEKFKNLITAAIQPDTLQNSANCFLKTKHDYFPNLPLKTFFFFITLLY